ncbi:MAG: hypothetical protein KAW56_09310 [Candidatus Marinimicrobia bacterium]|nr:hypothetical protein [Candidatus Neomarinimicrobiota bacterium]
MNQNIRDLNHPVWNIYDEYRTARLNVKINEYLLKNLKRYNFFIEFALAFMASSSVATFWFWENETGQIVWKYLCVFTAILAILKPLFNLGSKIQEKSEALADFKSLDHDFHKLTILISQYKKYDSDFREQFFYLIDKRGFINQKTKDGEIGTKKKQEFEEQVNRELPYKTFFIPEE